MPYWKEALVAIVGNTLLLVWFQKFSFGYALVFTAAVTAVVLVFWMLFKFLKKPND
jgi:hypothetical protein